MSKNIIAVINQKGGVGKTTTAINLGSYLAKLGKSVLIIDFDPQANATSGIGINIQNLDHSVYEVLYEPKSLKDALKPTNTKNLFILPATPSLVAAEVEFVNHPDRETKLKSVLAQTDYDYILIDCPPALGLLTINALVAANLIIIPVQAEYYALEGLGQLLKTIQRVKQSLNPDLELMGILLTMYSNRTLLSNQVANELDKHFSDKVFKTIVPRNVRLAEAPSFGKTISEHDKWSKGARAYKKLASEVVSRERKT